MVLNHFAESISPTDNKLMNPCILASTLRWFGFLSFTAILLPGLAMAQNYPGTGEDFTLATGINSSACTTGAGQDVKVAGAADSLYVCLDSPGGTFSGSPVALAANVLPAGSPLSGQPSNLWLDLSNNFYRLGLKGALPAAGWTIQLQIPSSLPGRQIILQSALRNSTALNGRFALSEAHVIKVLPTGIVMQPIMGSTFTMGDNNLRGPQAGQATEHQVTLSDYELSATEITNAQYAEFLNNAIAAKLITVQLGTRGPDAGKKLIVGTALSKYPGMSFYCLEGTRVMKDHDNADRDNHPFTGTIEPENPLNISFVGYDATRKSPFYVKDPFSPNDFDWHALCNYYNYTSVPRQLDKTVLLNDFSAWPELTGWTKKNPKMAVNLPNQQTVSAYPVGFIRWWGAQAFAEYYLVQLPTEAQWEYAAQAGRSYYYSVYDGTTIADANWNQRQIKPALHHVRAAMGGKANPFGLYNMGGNVWEWMWDNYLPYGAAAVKDPLILVSGSKLRSWRGGSWNYHQATLESSGRFFDDVNHGNDHFGFRIAHSP